MAFHIFNIHNKKDININIKNPIQSPIKTIEALLQMEDFSSYAFFLYYSLS